MLGAELYFAPHVVRSGTIGSTKTRQEEINTAIAVKKALSTSKSIQKLISRAARKVQPGHATVDVGTLNPQDREIRETQRSFIKNCEWWIDACSDHKEQALHLLVLLGSARITPTEYRIAIQGIAAAVRGPTLAEHHYYRPQAHPWSLPDGW